LIKNLISLSEFYKFSKSFGFYLIIRKFDEFHIYKPSYKFYEVLGTKKFSTMKNLSVVALIVLCMLNSLTAQDTSKRIKIYKTWVSMMNDPIKTTGVLYEIKDSLIVISNSFALKDYYKNRFEKTGIDVKNIELIKVRRKNNIGAGALTGLLVGFATGVMLGFMNGDDPPCSSNSWGCIRFSAEAKAMMGGITFGVIGVGIGALAGSIKISIPINGSLDKYNKNKSKLRKFAIKKY
jgi:hypothetical protein